MNDSNRGLLPEEKPELKRVLEQRRLDQHRQESLQPPSDLEQELRKRRHKLMQVHTAAFTAPHPFTLFTAF